MRKIIIAICIICVAAAIIVLFPEDNARIDKESSTELASESSVSNDNDIFDPSIAPYSDEETTTSVQQSTVDSQNTQDDADTSEQSTEGKVIVIDAGHQLQGNSSTEPIGPGASEYKAKVSSGTTGIATGTPEYVVNLQIAQKLEAVLKARGYSVTMVRTSNEVDISNSERAAVANDLNADAFLRIHCNGDDNQSVRGTLTMCQTASNPYCGEYYTQSRKLSEYILEAICSETGSQNRGVTETDTMSGINWCQVPVTIIETGFMSNPDEDKLLNDDAYQQKLATSIADGLDNYFKQ